jgi:cystathionine beta-lyase/cystathionine gamma-synthase
MLVGLESATDLIADLAQALDRLTVGEVASL